MVQPWMATVEPLRDSFTRSVKGSLLVLLGAVGLLLGAACANAASLLLARNRARRSEMAMRLALGASRGRLVRQLLTESLLLAMCAGALGVALGRYALYALVALAPRALTRSADVAIDGRVVLFAVAVSAATALLFGAVPAAVSARADVAPELARNSRGGGPRAGSLRAWLIAGEVAVSLILLTGGSLLFRSLVKLQEVDSGLMPRHLLAFHFRVPSPDKVNLFDLSRERIAVLPGVRAASATSFLPFDGPPAAARVEIEGRPAPAPGEEPVAAVRTVMPRYFGTIGIPIRQGRDFTAADNGADAPMRFVVNEAFVRKYLPGQEPLGRRIRTSMARTNPLGEIIGVVGDVKEGSMRQEPVPTVYYVYAHMSYGQMTLVVRTEGDPMAILALVRRVVHDLDPGLPVADARAMDAILGETYARERFSALLMAGFSILSLLVAAVGVYGVLACSVQERTREIGVRVAVGADGRRIVELVLGDTLRLVLPGLLAGLGGALSLSRLLSSLLFKTGAWDPASFAIAAGTLLVVALVAAASPAGRAARLDPTAALRLE